MIAVSPWRGEHRDAALVSAASEVMFGDFAECAQSQHTWSCLFDGGANTVFSRIDGWYCNFGPQSMGCVSMSVAVRGSVLVAERPSVHLLLSLCWAPTVQKERRRPLSTAMLSHPVYKECLEAPRQLTTDLSRRFSFRLRMPQRRLPRHRCCSTALKTPACSPRLRPGGTATAAAIAVAAPRLHTCRAEGSGQWHTATELRMHIAGVEAAICADIARFEKSAMPE